MSANNTIGWQLLLRNETARLSPVVFTALLAIALMSACNQPASASSTSDRTGIDEPSVPANAAAVEFALVPAGQFRMDGREVTISRPLQVAVTEVTIEQWMAVMHEPPRRLGCWSAMQGDRLVVDEPHRPVPCADLADAMQFANALSRAEGLEECYDIAGCDPAGQNWCERMMFAGLTCEGYRLPTEAEWEYAARPPEDELYEDPSPSDINQIAWHLDNSGGQVRAVAQLTPNSWGLYDMLGNVWEWTMDSYGDLNDLPSVDPLNFTREHEDLTEGIQGQAVVRGGSAYFGPEFANASYRGVAGSPDEVGFRLVRTVPAH